MPSLSEDKYERFANEYHIDCNRIAAVMRSGCWDYHDTKTDKHETFDPRIPEHRNRASAIASRLMLDPLVIIRINELEKARNQHVRLSAVRIVERFQHVAFDFQPEEGPTWKEVIAAAKELAKFDGTLYSENNKQRADAVGEMFKSVMATKDELPKHGRTEPTPPDST